MESISNIENSLNDLENALAPLFETDLSETEAKLDTLQKAKLQVLLPYVVNNLVFSYLRLRDVDASKHGVTAELERMAQYFSKIKSTERPEKRNLVVDQEAATRFIKHAIKEAVTGDAQKTHLRSNTTEASSSTAAIVSETKTTTTQTTTQAIITGAEPTPAALAKIEERKKGPVDDDPKPTDDDLMIVDDSTSSSKSEGKRKAPEDDDVCLKKKRKGIDPWTGFDDSTTVPGKSESQQTTSTPVAQNSEPDAAQSISHEDVDAPPTGKAMKTRKPRTKKKKKQEQQQQQQQKDIEVIDVDAEPSPVKGSSQPQSKPLPTSSVPVQPSGSNTSNPNKTKKKRKKGSKDIPSPIVISSDSGN